MSARPLRARVSKFEGKEVPHCPEAVGRVMRGAQVPRGGEESVTVTVVVHVPSFPVKSKTEKLMDDVPTGADCPERGPDSTEGMRPLSQLSETEGVAYETGAEQRVGEVETKEREEGQLITGASPSTIETSMEHSSLLLAASRASKTAVKSPRPVLLPGVGPEI